MINCILFEGDQSQPVKNCTVNFNVTGWVGEGEATVEFQSPQHSQQSTLSSAVLYVPALLFHESGSKTELSLVSCSLKWLGSNDGLVKTEDLALARSDWKSEPIERCKLHHRKLKDKLESRVLSLGCALSPNDLLLSVGSVEESVELHVNISFIFKIQPAVEQSTVDYVMAVMMPCNRLRLTASVTALWKVARVKALCNGDDSTNESCNTQSNLSSNINDTCVTCTLTSDTQSSTTRGIAVSLCTSPTLLKSSCFSVLLDKPAVVEGSSVNKSIYHGVQMLSSFPSTGSNALVENWEGLEPCEMLFMVDCSGSMCGMIDDSSQALVLALKSLPFRSRFNVVAFGTKSRFLFQESMEASPVYIEKAVQFANQLQPSLGGSELLTPLRWLLKKPLASDLRRELFLITDGGVRNISDVLHAVKKYKYLTRCHTFALGTDISSELMAGIAAETGGSFTVIDDDTRLQTKVMETVKLCLQPSVSNVSVTWPLPAEYTPSTKPFPPPLPVLFINKAYTHFTTLSKSELPLRNGSSTLSITPPTITGFLSGDRVQSVANLDHYNCHLSSNRSSVLLRNTAWCKMQSLYDELSIGGSTRKRGTDDGGRHQATATDDEPPLKKPRLDKSLKKRELTEEIIAISLGSGVPFYPFTHFQSTSAIGSERVCQVLPWNGPVPHVQKPPSSSSRIHGSNQTTSTRPDHHQHTRKRKRNHSALGHDTAPLTLSSLAKQTASSVCSVFKTVINIASFGYINMETTDDSALEGGERIEDQDYYQGKHERIHWNDHNELILPKIYYKSHNTNEQDRATNGGSSSRDEFIIPRTHSSSSESGGHNDSEITSQLSIIINNGTAGLHTNNVVTFDALSSANNLPLPLVPFEDDSLPMDISSPPILPLSPLPNMSYMNLVQLQLPSGGWPLIPAISPAVGVPMDTIRGISSRSNTSTTSGNGSVLGVGDGNVWASLLAIACLENNFTKSRVEWELLVLKGQSFIERNKHSINVPLADARALVMEIINPK